MNSLWPHEFFRLDFDQVVEEARRQEVIYPPNKGELAIAMDLHAFFSRDVLAMIVDNDWVYEAAERFAQEFARDCFRNLDLAGQEIYETQNKLVELKEQVADFIAEAVTEKYASLEGVKHITKMSDFTNYLKPSRMTVSQKRRAKLLLDKTKNHEDLQIRVTLRGIRDCYEIAFTRIMYVGRRAMKVNARKKQKPSDTELKKPSDYIDWLASHTPKDHILNRTFVQHREFYRAARNVASHHLGLNWKPNSDKVILPDQSNTITVHIDDFQQRFRILRDFCELGLRGILSAFCERERGLVSNRLVEEYYRTFPPNWAGGKAGVFTFYNVDSQSREGTSSQ